MFQKLIVDKNVKKKLNNRADGRHFAFEFRDQQIYDLDEVVK